MNKINKEVLTNFGLKNGATHSEFIRGEDGQFYFLETSSRVGGAHIPDMIEAATGVNIWKEWAKIENALLRNEKYSLKEPKKAFGGLIVSLAKEKHPETEPFHCEEVAKFLSKDFHVGIVYCADSADKVRKRLDEAAFYISTELLSILPAQDKPTS